MPDRPKPVVLIMCDGWGVAPDTKGNAITHANTPVFKKLLSTYPAMTLRASGEEVGLSWGEMGNSEVGHLTAGAGKVLYQTFPRINKSIESGEFFENQSFLGLTEAVKKSGGALHLMGILSPGRVHGMDAHVWALLEFAKAQKLKNVFVHAFLDGRDTLYNSGIDFVKELQVKMKELKIGKLASLVGRYYAMDRDNRWDRIEEAYRMLTEGKGEQAPDPVTALEEAYRKEIYDEQLPPVVITEKGAPVATIKSGDAVIFWNFRPDRARELTHAFVDGDFKGFAREKIQPLEFVTMAEYEAGLSAQVMFPTEKITRPLARVLSEAGLKQLHIAETEKYAHVTFFFNGTKEEPFPGEERVIVPSPKVASYDQKPEMSAYELTDKVAQAIKAGKHDFIVMNFANADMVGHTGNLEATIRAVEVVDECLGRIVDEVLVKKGVVVITADHGNAEEVMNLQTGDIDKEHSTNPIPLLVVGEEFAGKFGPMGPSTDLGLMPPVGMLADVAPTILRIMNIPQPPEMTGAPLV